MCVCVCEGVRRREGRGWENRRVEEEEQEEQEEELRRSNRQTR